MSLDLSLTFEGHRVRMLGTPESPAFVAKDVCRVLGIHNSRDALRDIVPEGEKGVGVTDTLGGPQEVATVTEGGLWRLASRSHKPSAGRFQSWLFNEVVPSLRKTGQYPPPAALALPAIDLRDPLQLARVTAQALQLVAELQPKADALDRLSEAKGDVNLQNAGRILGRQPNLFIQTLVEDGVLFHTTHGKHAPHHQWREAGYFLVRVREFDGEAYIQTMVTPRGLVWLAGRYPVSDAVSGQLSLLPGRQAQATP
jgi:anti-repressor protein